MELYHKLCENAIEKDEIYASNNFRKSIAKMLIAGHKYNMCLELPSQKVEIQIATSNEVESVMFEKV